MKSHTQPTDLNQETTISINANIAGDEWFTAIEDQATLPNRFKLRSQHTTALMFALTCSILASFLYAEGGKKYGPYTEAGGIAVNFTQNMLYNILTYFFIMMPERSWSRIIPAFLFALLATTPSTLSTYELSEDHRVEKTIFNALGNIAGNTFGMYTAFNRCMNYFSDNPQARAFLKKAIRTHLQDNDELSNALESEHGPKTQVAGYLLGIVMGVNLASAHTGYICTSSKYIEKLIGNQDGGIALGIASMLPNLTIALLLSGVDLGIIAVNDIANIYNYMTGNKKIILSSREIKLLSGLVTAIGISSCLALYSSATSKFLFANRCDLEPVIGNHLNNFLEFTTDKGAMVFNAIMSGIALKTGVDYVKTAYAAPESAAIKKYKVTAMDKWVQQAPTEKVEAITRKYFSANENEWKKSPSCFTRLRNRFFQSNPTRYQALDDAPVNTMSPNI
ncbi:MAG: hypothetical protein P4M12_08195 [Gammaproteobacteria bacterium]|nr:hypothetical protein [Gammaproteobacteria bacterium]